MTVEAECNDHEICDEYVYVMDFDGSRAEIVFNLAFDAVQVTLVHSDTCDIQYDDPCDNDYQDCELPQRH